MLINKVVPYPIRKNLLKVALFASPMLLAPSCDKDEPIDPTKEKIEQLTAKSEIEAKELRAAIKPALTIPEDIEGWYWEVFKATHKTDVLKNLLDSAKVHETAIHDMYEVYGDPMPKNDENIKKLYGKAKTYIATMTELNNLKTK